MQCHVSGEFAVAAAVAGAVAAVITTRDKTNLKKCKKTNIFGRFGLKKSCFR